MLWAIARAIKIGPSAPNENPVQPDPLPRITPYATYALIALCALAFALQAPFPRLMLGQGALWPWGENFELWQLVTYSFLHGDPSHLIFNMLGVYMFGAELERLFGTRRFLVLYFAGVVSAAFAQLLFAQYTGSSNPTIGASGGLFGLLLAFAMIFPKRTIVPLIPPIPMPAWLFVTLYAGLELYLGVTGTFEGIAHFAHLGGLVGAFLVLTYWRMQTRRRRQLR